jgi:hypothetical protein
MKSDLSFLKLSKQKQQNKIRFLYKKHHFNKKVYNHSFSAYFFKGRAYHERNFIEK